MGWTPFFTVLLSICVLVVPERRWARTPWLSWVLLSIATGTFAIHQISGSVCTGVWRLFDVGIL
jgi:hypothetical protein